MALAPSNTLFDYKVKKLPILVMNSTQTTFFSDLQMALKSNHTCRLKEIYLHMHLAGQDRQHPRHQAPVFVLAD